MKSWMVLLAAGGSAAAFNVTAAPVEPAWTLAQKEKPAVVETLRELVGIESGSCDREGLDRVADVIAAKLAAECIFQTCQAHK